MLRLLAAFTTICIVMTNIPTPSFANPNEDFLARKLKEMKKKAFEGDLESQYDMGVVYLEGFLGVKRDINKGVEWFKIAAKQNHTPSIVVLGMLYKKKKPFGFKTDHKKAFEYFKKAALLSDKEGMYELGCCYHQGIGVKKNIAESLIWLNKAAGLGDRQSQLYLGNLYYCGKDVIQDYKKAFELFSKTTDYLVSEYMLGKMYYFGEGVKKDLAVAKKWMEKASKHGYEKATKFLKKHAF